MAGFDYDLGQDMASTHLTTFGARGPEERFRKTVLMIDCLPNYR
jgi:hypothetical protein